ncbi:putative membrane protein [Helicobacter pylori CPY3281]|nr:putative membrane protein [Helicobacter pylori CPY3281]
MLLSFEGLGLIFLLFNSCFCLIFDFFLFVIFFVLLDLFGFNVSLILTACFWLFKSCFYLIYSFFVSCLLF